MRTAHPLGLSPDGRNLIVVVDGGEQVSIPADDRLRAALRNDRARMGQLEIDMESALRPRDIQARIRAGESLEAVAQAAGVPIEKIEPFAAPMLAERDYIAGLAQTNPVRRAGDAVAHRSLRSVVSDRLLSRGIDPDDVEWDAWRTEDRRWTVRLSYESGSSHRQADFTYDQTGRFATAANDDARWLTGEHSGSHGPQPGRKRRGDAEGESRHELNDELAIVRAIQPQFAITPDVEDEDDLADDIADDGVAGGSEDDEGTPDNEDAFTEGDLAEVDGVYDIVPGDRSNMDVLYDMLSSFDEDSVQIYAGLVRPRPDESAAPVLHEGPAAADRMVELSEPVTDPADADFTDIDEPTQRIEDDDTDAPDEPAADAEGSANATDAADPDTADEAEVADDPDAADHQDAELDFAEPSPAALAEVTDDDLVAAADEQPDPAAETAPPVDEAPAAEAIPSEGTATEDVAVPADAEEADAETTEDAAAEPGVAEEPAEAESKEPATKPRPGKIKPSPAEPEQPSLVDEAANEPSRPIKRKRASVPSWDEIMFGAPKPKE